MSKDIKMYSLLEALSEVKNAYDQGKESITLRGIQRDCAKRVSELFGDKVKLDHFAEHKDQDRPCTTFTFV